MNASPWIILFSPLVALFIIVLVTERGAMLIDLSGDGSFPFAALERAAGEAARTIACAADLEEDVAQHLNQRVANKVLFYGI